MKKTTPTTTTTTPQETTKRVKFTDTFFILIADKEQYADAKIDGTPVEWKAIFSANGDNIPTPFSSKILAEETKILLDNQTGKPECLILEVASFAEALPQLEIVAMNRLTDTIFSAYDEDTRKTLEGLREALGLPGKEPMQAQLDRILIDSHPSAVKDLSGVYFNGVLNTIQQLTLAGMAENSSPKLKARVMEIMEESKKAVDELTK